VRRASSNSAIVLALNNVVIQILGVAMYVEFITKNIRRWYDPQPNRFTCWSSVAITLYLQKNAPIKAPNTETLLLGLDNKKYYKIFQFASEIVAEYDLRNPIPYQISWAAAEQNVRNAKSNTYGPLFPTGLPSSMAKDFFCGNLKMKFSVNGKGPGKVDLGNAKALMKFIATKGPLVVFTKRPGGGHLRLIVGYAHNQGSTSLPQVFLFDPEEGQVVVDGPIEPHLLWTHYIEQVVDQLVDIDDSKGVFHW
jgi:Papain-like cysteine protease AvrRpt2